MFWTVESNPIVPGLIIQGEHETLEAAQQHADQLQARWAERTGAMFFAMPAKLKA